MCACACACETRKSHHHKVEKKVRLDTDHTPSPVVKKNLMQDFCGAHKMDEEGPPSCVSFVGGGTATATTPITDPKEESMKLAKGFSNFLSKREGKRVYLRAPMEQFLRTYLHLKKNPSKDAPDSSHDDSASMPSLESPTHVVVEQMMTPRGRMPLKYRPTLKYRATPKHRVTEPAVVETVHLSDDDDGSVQPE